MLRTNLFLSLTLIALAISSQSPALAKKPLEGGKAVVSKSKAKPAPVRDRKLQLRANYHFNTAEEHRRAKDYSAAIEEYKKAIADVPDDPDFYKHLGGTYAQMGKLKEAEDALRTGVKLDPKDWLLWNNLAVTLQMAGKNDECVAALKKALTLHPPDSEAEKMKVTLDSLSGDKGKKGPSKN
ncbi:MAG: tetratricopeptide repeat protein [Candidatus Obscuribacterales bacterium]